MPFSVCWIFLNNRPKALPLLKDATIFWIFGVFVVSKYELIERIN